MRPMREEVADGFKRWQGAAWPLAQSALEPYLRLMPPVDYALRNARVLIRRALRALRDDEVIPDALCEALEALGDSVQILCAELVDGRAPTDSKRRLLAVARRAGTGMIAGAAFSSTVLVAQLRSITVDMLQATGMTRDEALAALPSPTPAGSRAG
jgi:hypothetical protein